MLLIMMIILLLVCLPYRVIHIVSIKFYVLTKRCTVICSEVPTVLVQRRSCSTRFVALRTLRPATAHRRGRSPIGGPVLSSPSFAVFIISHFGPRTRFRTVVVIKLRRTSAYCSFRADTRFRQHRSEEPTIKTDLQQSKSRIDSVFGQSYSTIR